MAEYKINAPGEKKVLDAFGMNNIKCFTYEIKDDIRESGLQIPNQLLIQGAERQLYRAGIEINQERYEAGNIANRNNLKSEDNKFVQNRYLGGAVFSQLKFGDITNGGFNIRHLFPIDTCLFTVNQVKNIVRTSISGRNGTIKELISDGDYTINIKGIIQGANGLYPTEAVESLMQYLKLPMEIPIEIPYLQEVFGVEYIVVDSYDMIQEAGGISQQMFNINCTSDVANDVIFFKQNS